MTLIGSSGNYRMFIRRNKEGIKLITITVAYILFLGLGGLAFWAIEGSEEAAEKSAVLKAKEEALKKFPNAPGEVIDYFVKELSKNGVRGLTTSNSTKWTIANSVLYATTLVTTIGYGHLAAVSVLGKIATMFYTSVGIPLTLFVLSTYVDRLHKLSDFFLTSLFYRLISRLTMRKIRMIHFFIMMLFVIVGCFLFPAFLFSCLEVDWSYFDSIYFCFISLTTVGLGDYVPGMTMVHPLVELYRFGAIVFLMTGVTVMMFVLAMMTDLVNNFNKPFHETMPPMMMPSEKLAICPADRLPSYGTITVQVTKTCDDNDTNALLP